MPRVPCLCSTYCLSSVKEHCLTRKGDCAACDLAPVVWGCALCIVHLQNTPVLLLANSWRGNIKYAGFFFTLSELVNHELEIVLKKDMAVRYTLTLFEGTLGNKLKGRPNLSGRVEWGLPLSTVSCILLASQGSGLLPCYLSCVLETS